MELPNIKITKSPESVTASCVIDNKLSIANVDNLKDGRWWVSRVNVQGVIRGNGVGSMLLRKAIKAVRSFGETEIIVAPGGYNGDLEKQINFYKKNGFVSTNEEGLLSFKKIPRFKKRKDNSRIKITDHAYLRANERLSLNKKSLDRLTKTSFEKGIKYSDTNGDLKKYITQIWIGEKTPNIRIYGEFIYFFRNKTLITLYQVPNEFKKILKNYKTKKEI